MRLIYVIVFVLSFGQLVAQDSLSGVWVEGLVDSTVLEGPKDPMRIALLHDRDRLGASFSSVVLDYSMRGTSGSSYWVATILWQVSSGNKEEAFLSALIYSQIVYNAGSRNKSSDSDQFRSAIMLAVIYESLGSRLSAERMYNRSETVLSTNDELLGSFPALDETERRIYETVRERCKP